MCQHCVSPLSYVRHEGLQFCNFREVSIEELRQRRQELTRSPVKSCTLDLLPTLTQRELVDVTPTVRDTSSSTLR